MELSLKRALKLRKELEAALSRVDLPLTTNVSLLVESNITVVDSTRSNARAVLLERIHQYRDLSNILKQLRFDLANANISSGVEEMLAEMAAIDREIGLLRKLVSGNTEAPEDELRIELSALRNTYMNGDRTNSYREPAKVVSVDILTDQIKADALGVIAELRRQREELEDKRAYTNGTTKIKIADESAELLRKLAIL